ncbi:MAG: hypothetical protein HYY25_13650 [Candidatus Wallbacteria bacterium]|nr:hypothetical protein [Candidatus Wallbacteria bacterium]
MRIYSAVVGAWSRVFAIVGLAFLAAPDQTGAFLTTLANALGLRGTIAAPASNLWWVLSLSLMATITALAAVSARAPHLYAPYAALMTAKLVSTAGFLGLAATQGAVWLTCAAGDALVAVTIWLARMAVPVPDLPRGFRRVHEWFGPRYETYFGMVDMAPGRALWFRYTLLDGMTREAAVWGVFFDGESVVSEKRGWPLDRLSPGNCLILPQREDLDRFLGRPQVFHLGDAHLDSGNALGSSGQLSWDLTWSLPSCGPGRASLSSTRTGEGRHFSHVPALMRLLGVAKSSYEGVLLDARVSGSVQYGRETLRFEAVTGMLGHIEGERMADTWAWAHCNRFDASEDAAFDAISAFVTAGGRRLGPLSSFVLFVGEREYRFSGLRRIASAVSRFGDDAWSFETEADGVRLAGEARLPAVTAMLEYRDTDGSARWCRNSRLSTLELRLTDPGAAGERVLRSTGAASFELVERTRPSASS